MPQNNKYIISERRHRVADLYLKGAYQSKIAKELDISQQQVSHDLQILRRAWQMSALVSIDKITAKELAKIDKLEEEYWVAWERSKEDYTQKSSKVKGSELGKDKKLKAEYLEQLSKNIVQVGDPRFLAGVERCIKQRREIFGIDAPEKHKFEVDKIIDVRLPDEIKGNGNN